MRCFPSKHTPAHLAGLVCLVALSSAFAAGPRALPEGKQPKDKRLGELKNLNGYFPFTPASSPTDWMLRSEQLRRQILLANGLWPMPTKTPHNAVIHGKVDRDEYTVEKVFLESYPGHFVTGSLYRPKGKTGRLPGVLCPHGHWANGRFHDHGEKAIERELASGGEKFAIGGRHPLQARCVHLARMGCVVFHYDMIGYADSVQIVHRPGPREAMNTPENWGFFSPQAELRLQSMMGLQTYNSDPRARLVLRAAGCRSQADRRHRRQRRRDANVHAVRDRSTAGRGVSRGDGLDGHARGLHVRKLQLPARRNGERRDRGAVFAQAAGNVGRRRLDQGDGNQGPAGAEAALRHARRAGQRDGEVFQVPAQLQPR